MLTVPMANAAGMVVVVYPGTEGCCVARSLFTTGANSVDNSSFKADPQFAYDRNH